MVVEGAIPTAWIKTATTAPQAAAAAEPAAAVEGGATTAGCLPEVNTIGDAVKGDFRALLENFTRSAPMALRVCSTDASGKATAAEGAVSAPARTASADAGAEAGTEAGAEASECEFNYNEDAEPIRGALTPARTGRVRELRADVHCTEGSPRRTLLPHALPSPAAAFSALSISSPSRCVISNTVPFRANPSHPSTCASPHISTVTQSLRRAAMQRRARGVP